MNDESYLNYDLINYNQLLIEANRLFQQKDVNGAIRCYSEALDTNEAMQSLEKTATIKTNLGVIAFHNCEYKKSLQYLQDAYDQINNYKSDQQQPLLIKILGNLCIVNLVNNNYEQSKECNEHALEIIYNVKQDPQKQRLLFEELVFIYFRFTSFEAMGDGSFENLEQKYDGQTLGCFYSSMGINRELCNDLQMAYKGMVLVQIEWIYCYHPKETDYVGHIVFHNSLGQMINVPQAEMKEYVCLLQRYLQTDELKGLSADVLFKDCEKKIQCAREITLALRHYEDNSNYKPMNNEQSDEEPLWKIALRLRLTRAVNVSRAMLPNSEQQESLLQTINQLQMTIYSISQPQPQIVENQMINQSFTKESINHLKAEINRIRKLANKFACSRFFEIYRAQKREEFLQTQYMKQQSLLKTQQLQQQFESLRVQQQSQSHRVQEENIQQSQRQGRSMQDESQQFNNNQQSKEEVIVQQLTGHPQPVQGHPHAPVQNIQSSIVNSAIKPNSTIKTNSQSQIQILKIAYQIASLGDYLIKCNKNTNGRIQRFFKLGMDNTFRWAAKDKYINDPNKIQYYQVSDIRGILYGKCSEVLNKSYNRQLESWLCFSLVMKTRSMDFYLEPDQVLLNNQTTKINPWFIALSEEIRRKNAKSFTLRPGRFFWRKLKLILHWFFVVGSSMKKKDKKFKLSFVKTIISFGRNGFKLPKIEI